MVDLPLGSMISLWVLAGLFAAISIALFVAQIYVLSGRAFPNPDGSTDDWHEQPIIFGMALADVIFAVPVTLIGVAMLWVDLKVGVFVLSMSGFWMIYANIFTTATSLRFHKPRLTLVWVLAFPFGIVLGLAMLFWVWWHFALLFGN